MQTYVLIDDRGEIVDSCDDPSKLNFEFMRGQFAWTVAFRTEPTLNAGGPLTVIANVDYNGYPLTNHDWIARMVRRELAHAVEFGELTPYTSDGPLVDISDLGGECDWCGCVPCGCGG